MRPGQRLAVDVLLEQPLAHHQPEIFPRSPPGRVGALVDDVAQIVEAAGLGRLAGLQPGFARLPALPGARGEAEDLDLDAAALQRAGENVGAGRGDGDRPAAHRAGIVEQQRHHRVAEIGVALLLEGQRRGRVDDDARQARRIEHAFLEIEIPGAVLLRHQAALQPVGEARRRRPDRWRAACRDRRAGGRAPPASHRSSARRRSRRTGSRRPCSRARGARCRGDRRPPGLAGLARRRRSRSPPACRRTAIGLLRLALLAVVIARLGLLERIACDWSSASLSPSWPSLSWSWSAVVLAVVLVLPVGIAPSRRPCRVRPADRGRSGEGALVLDDAVEPRRGRSPAFSSIQRPPEVDELRGRRRRREPGQLLAHHHARRVLDRRVRAVGDVLVLAAAKIAVLQHRREISARRRPCAASRSPRRAPARPRRRPRAPACPRREAAVHASVVAGEAQRHRIGLAAHDRDVVRRRACAAAPAGAPCRRSAPAGPRRRRPRDPACRRWRACSRRPRA